MENGDRELLIRIDERMNSLGNDIKEMKGTLVSREEFDPVKKIVYGLVAIILMGVLTTALTFILR